MVHDFQSKDQVPSFPSTSYMPTSFHPANNMQNGGVINANSGQYLEEKPDIYSNGYFGEGQGIIFRKVIIYFKNFFPPQEKGSCLRQN